jgi:hypothetical protein
MKKLDGPVDRIETIADASEHFVRNALASDMGYTSRPLIYW